MVTQWLKLTRHTHYRDTPPHLDIDNTTTHATVPGLEDVPTILAVADDKRPENFVIQPSPSLFIRIFPIFYASYTIHKRAIPKQHRDYY